MLFLVSRPHDIGAAFSEFAEPLLSVECLFHGSSLLCYAQELATFQYRTRVIRM